MFNIEISFVSFCLKILSFKVSNPIEEYLRASIDFDACVNVGEPLLLIGIIGRRGGFCVRIIVIRKKVV